MRKKMMLWTGAFLVIFAFISFSWLIKSGLGREQATLQPFFQKLPDSLDKYYKGKGRPYTLAMIELGRLMGASFEEAYTKDYDASLKTFGDFKKQFRKVGGMVPEWKSYFQEEPLQKMEELLKQAASASEIKKAAKRVEGICTECHINEMFKVLSVYHWTDFEDISTTDEEGMEVGFHEVMMRLSNLLAVIPNKIKRKDFEGAHDHYKDLVKNFTYLEMSCNFCHDQPREYFVDQRVKSRWYRIGGLLRKESVDFYKYQEIVDDIYDKSCIPCHRVHMPAAFMQMYLKQERTGER